MTRSGLRRRQLLAGFGLGAGVALSGPAAALASREIGAWDDSVDVLVAGSGSAACSAAIEARRSGARVLLIESLPRFGGSSIGIEIAEDVAAARALAASSVHLRTGAVVEPYRPELVDLNIAFRTFPSLEITQLEKPLRGPAGSALYSYAEKYLAGGAGADAGLTSAPREFPAEVPEAVHTRARELAERVADVTRLTGIVRVDLLLDEASSELYVNEVNTIPGALSLYLWAPQQPAATVLVDALTEARDRRVVFPQAGFGGGAALRAAGGIAGKLVGLDGPRA